MLGLKFSYNFVAELITVKPTHKKNRQKLKIYGMKKILLIIILPMLALSSCSIEKRLHLSGYHIEWKNSNDCTEKLAERNNNRENNEVTEVENCDIPTKMHDTSVVITETSAPYRASADKKTVSKVKLLKNDIIKKTKEDLNYFFNLQRPDIANIKKAQPTSPVTKSKEGVWLLIGGIASILAALLYYGRVYSTFYFLLGIIAIIIGIVLLMKE